MNHGCVPQPDRADAAKATPRAGILRRIVKAFNGDIFTRVASLFGAAQRIVPRAP
ncbi:MAG: hypothetical protein ACRDJH_17210 [Thermomicrobiales bacterium]